MISPMSNGAAGLDDGNAGAQEGKLTPEVPVTIWSDWHLGEVVERAEMNGFNEFSMAIARAAG